VVSLKEELYWLLEDQGPGRPFFAAQFLYKGIYEHNENGVFVSLDESKDHFYSEMQQFGWDFKKAEEERKFAFIDATRISRVAMLKEELYKEETRSLRGKQLPIDKLVEELQAKIQWVGAKRVAGTRLQHFSIGFRIRLNEELQLWI